MCAVLPQLEENEERLAALEAGAEASKGHAATLEQHVRPATWVPGLCVPHVQLGAAQARGCWTDLIP